jgi:hypothetical protein
MYFKNVKEDQQPVYLSEIYEKYKGDWKKFADHLFEKSIFSTPEKVDAFLAKPNAKVLKKDPALTLWSKFLEDYRKLAKEAEPYSV